MNILNIQGINNGLKNLPDAQFNSLGDLFRATDTLDPTGNAGKVVTVNATNDGYELASGGGGSSNAGAIFSRVANDNQALSSSVPAIVLFQDADTTNELNPTSVGVDYVDGVFTNNGASTISLIVAFNLTYQSAAGLSPKTYVEKNGDATQNYGPVNWYISGDRPIHANAVPISLAPTEYFSVVAQQSSGAVKSLLYAVGPDDSFSTKISVTRVNA
jgi:hypothetical protein